MLLVLAAVALGWNLNGYRLLDPDEGRNPEVAPEMGQSNDHFVPPPNRPPYPGHPTRGESVGRVAGEAGSRAAVSVGPATSMTAAAAAK